MIHDAEHVGQGLLARRPDGDPRVRPRRLEQARHRVGEGPAVALDVELAQDGERRRDLAHLLGLCREEALVPGAQGWSRPRPTPSPAAAR